MQNWMNEQVGFKGFFHKIQKEAPHWAQTIPTIPRLFTTLLEKNINSKQEQQLEEIINELKKSKKANLTWKFVSIFLIGVCTGGFTLLLLIN
jgi:ubiquinone biosynthesis protein